MLFGFFCERQASPPAALSLGEGSTPTAAGRMPAPRECVWEGRGAWQRRPHPRPHPLDPLLRSGCPSGYPPKRRRGERRRLGRILGGSCASASYAAPPKSYGNGMGRLESDIEWVVACKDMALHDRRGTSPRPTTATAWTGRDVVYRRGVIYHALVWPLRIGRTPCAPT